MSNFCVNILHCYGRDHNTVCQLARISFCYVHYRTVTQLSGELIKSLYVLSCYGGIHDDVIVYIFAHLYTALRTEGNMLDTN